MSLPVAPAVASAMPSPTAYEAEVPVLSAVAIAEESQPTVVTAISISTDPILATSASAFASSEPSPLSEGLSDEEKSMHIGAWKKNCWSAEEDLRLRELIIACGPKVRWSIIGEQMEGRSGKQCRERWHNHLSPEVNKNKWSAEEDNAIIEAVHTFGTRWSEIVKMFPGRTDNAIKNRWNSMQRKETRRQKRMHDHSAFVAAAAQVAARQAQAAVHYSGYGIDAPAAAGGEAVLPADEPEIINVTAVAIAEPEEQVEVEEAEHVEEEEEEAATAPPPAQRRRLIQASDLQPAAALRAVAPDAAPEPVSMVTTSDMLIEASPAAVGAPLAVIAAPVVAAPAVAAGAFVAAHTVAKAAPVPVQVGPALAQQIAASGVTAPLRIKPGGRRKRAVQAASDLSAASLVLGLCGQQATTSTATAVVPAATVPAAVVPAAAASAGFGSPALATRPSVAAATAAVAVAAAAVAASSSSPAVTVQAKPGAVRSAGPVTATLARAVRAFQPTPSTLSASAFAAPPPAVVATPAPAAAPAVAAPAPAAPPTGLVKASFLANLQVPPRADKENSCSDSPARAFVQSSGSSPAPHSKVLTPSGSANSPCRRPSSLGRVRRMGAAFEDARSMEAATLLAGFAGF
jgi:hypothetical protein